MVWDFGTALLFSRSCTYCIQMACAEHDIKDSSGYCLMHKKVRTCAKAYSVNYTGAEV